MPFLTLIEADATLAPKVFDGDQPTEIVCFLVDCITQFARESVEERSGPLRDCCDLHRREDAVVHAAVLVLRIAAMSN